MTQTGFIKRIKNRSFEDYISLKKYVKSKYSNLEQISECFLHRTQTTPTSATPVEFEETGGLTISDAGKTAKTLVMAASANNNTYDGKTITIHYLTNTGTAKTAVGTFNSTDSTTEVAFVPAVTDFYCWDLENYTISTVIVASVAAAAGEAFYIGTTGLTAEIRYATIDAAATVATQAKLFGVGNLYGAEESNTAGDVGKVVTMKYWTPWGTKKTATITLAANTTTIQRFIKSDGTYVQDFYRRYEFETTAALGKYVVAGIDADKMAGTVALDTNYFH